MINFTALNLSDSLMKRLLTGFAIALLTISATGQARNYHEIKVTVDGLRDSSIYLAYHLGDKQYITDTVKLDNRGYGVFAGRDTLGQGIYMIVLPGKKYFEFLVPDNQKFSINCSYTDYFNTLRFTGSIENSAFVEYQRKWIELQKEVQGISQRLQQNRQNEDSLKILSEKKKTQETRMKIYLRKVAADNGNNILAAIVRSMIPVDLPEFSVPAFVNNPDSLKWLFNYNYTKDHFFDNIDLTDERLLRTPIIQAHLDAYFKNVLIQAPDSINKAVDKIIARSQGNYRIFQFVAVYLFNHFRESQIMGHDAVMVKIADDIYLSGKAPWVSKKFKEDLSKQVELLRHNLIGMKAENLVMDSYKGIFVSLYDIEKDFTVLYFWEPNCGHCKEATPKLKEYYEKAKNEGVEIFAVCTTNERDLWLKYIEENGITWINGWDPERKTNYDYFYNVQSTPIVYILDRNKKIIAKNISVNDIDSFLKNYRKFFR
jgi:thiol-disulfide isomerase/thioredoxin